jgi:5-formyltetrahydrofolate cyclo-ligase
MDTNALRAATKAKRNQLPAEKIVIASLEIATRLWRLPLLSRARRIAAYYAIGGEVDCQFAINFAWERGRDVFLPVLHRQELMFAPYSPNSEFLRNKYGIPEPIYPKAHFIHPREMDVVLAPLVAFDANGNRVGIGGGYYDRSFRFMRDRKQWTRPHLIGLAHEFQKVPQIKACSWDVPLQKVVTENNIYTF